MTSAVLAVAIVGMGPWGSGYYEGCSSCGCRNHWYGTCHGPLTGWYRGKEYFFGSWYMSPILNGNCNERFHLSPAPHQGYYYFQPYNYRHLVQHSQDGAAFGEDAQMPYSNEVFRRRYRQKPEATPDNNTDPEPAPIEPRPVAPGTGQPQEPRSGPPLTPTLF